MAAKTPEEVRKPYVLGPKHLYVLGSFEKGVTIYNQQVRALNLAWALEKSVDKRVLENVAVIGGGFAGLTFAAGLLRKGIPHITLFEKRPVFCPLQQGSDSRWVHPHIYDWPTEGSEFPSAALPIMNWTAGRASDVVARVMANWNAILQEPGTDKVKPAAERIEKILSVKYLKVQNDLSVDWMVDSTAREHRGGNRRKFTAVILALGFGPERDLEESGTVSYWRNESLGQTELSPGVKTFLVSGYGDGALIDLFRIRIEHFRQDRILLELSRNAGTMLESLRKLKAQCDDGSPHALKGLYRKLKDLANRDPNFTTLTKSMEKRLRQDTAAVLRINRAKTLDDLFAHPSSFQNKLLMFLLFKVGGFIPCQSNESEESICKEFGISSDRIVRRHGPKTDDPFREVLSEELFKRTFKRREDLKSKPKSSVELKWNGGYWDSPSDKFMKKATNAAKASWRHEYLPIPTELLALSLASTVASLISPRCGTESFRVTVHRALSIGGDCLLQQCCDYKGNPQERSGKKGRTFGADQGTIGVSYRTGNTYRTIVKKAWTKKDAHHLNQDMTDLSLGKHSQAMAAEVKSILALPVVSKGRTIMVLFADSYVPNLFGDGLVRDIRLIVDGFCKMLAGIQGPGLRNYTMVYPGARVFNPPRLRIVQEISGICPAVTHPEVQSFNFELASYEV